MWVTFTFILYSAVQYVFYVRTVVRTHSVQKQPMGVTSPKDIDAMLETGGPKKIHRRSDDAKPCCVLCGVVAEVLFRERAFPPSNCIAALVSSRQGTPQLTTERNPVKDKSSAYT